MILNNWVSSVAGTTMVSLRDWVLLVVILCGNQCGFLVRLADEGDYHACGGTMGFRGAVREAQREA